MFLRVLLTAASLMVAAVAAVIVECWSPAFEYPVSDPIRLCSTMSALGIDYGFGIGVGLALLATLSLIATWVPAARPASMRTDLEPVLALKHNLDRLADVGIKTAALDGTTDSHRHLTRLSRRLEAVERALAADSPSTRETTHEWMRLLHEANDLHNSGDLDTPHFKQINTCLVGLFMVPDQSQELSASHSG
jgi:hypothetical protein